MQDNQKDIRFKFGKNWANFLKHLDDDRIKNSQEHLLKMLNTDSLGGKSFLDIGSGSGLSSLAARKAGARVFSFDYDEQSYACTDYLKETYYSNDTNWQVQRGSVLDEHYMSDLGEFDYVYSWGVLHHTGDMNEAMRIIDSNLKKGGKLYIAIYNDQGFSSKVWRVIKRAYVSFPSFLKPLILLPCYFRIWGSIFLYDLFFRGDLMYSWKATKEERGMSPHYDVIDWVGGYPFEVASVEQIFGFYRKLGYDLESLVTVGKGHGCNEYVFIKR